MGETEPCACDEANTEGERRCAFDADSPLDGYFGACQDCEALPPAPVERCEDEEKNGFESDTDCGGPDCEPCPMGSSCVSDTDCEAGTCEMSLCGLPMTGTAGAPGTGGSDGTSGAGSGGTEAPPPPVEDCNGQPMGTPCVRDCLLDDRISVCDDEGDCECERL
jgi:hypothetical protein